MAIPIDPTDQEFLSDIRLTGGRFRGRTLCEVASTESGLVYLSNIISKTRPSFISIFIHASIEAFLGTPERTAVLSRLKLR